MIGHNEPDDEEHNRADDDQPTNSTSHATNLAESRPQSRWRTIGGREGCLVNPVSGQRGAIFERRSVLPAGMRVAHRNNGQERYGRRHSQDNQICNPTPHAIRLALTEGEPALRPHNFRFPS